MTENKAQTNEVKAPQKRVKGKQVHATVPVDVFEAAQEKRFEGRYERLSDLVAAAITEFVKK